MKKPTSLHIVAFSSIYIYIQRPNSSPPAAFHLHLSASKRTLNQIHLIYFYLLCQIVSHSKRRQTPVNVHMHTSICRGKGDAGTPIWHNQTRPLIATTVLRTLKFCAAHSPSCNTHTFSQSHLLKDFSKILNIDSCWQKKIGMEERMEKDARVVSRGNRRISVRIRFSLKTISRCKFAAANHFKSLQFS